MDAELRDLINKFQSLQRSESTTKVNDRNVVEIVNVLQKKKKLIDIIFTADGKEFLTWSQLRTEIENEIVAVGGRMNIVDLAGPLNVDMIHIERCLPSVMEQQPNAVMLGGEIIFQTYIDSIVQDAADVLKEKGFLLFSDLARSHQLPSTFLVDLLTRAADDGRLHAECHEAALYTKQFVHAQRMLLRSALLASTKPVNLQSAAFLSRCDLYAPLLTSIAEGLAPQLPGRLESLTFVPLKFERERDNRIRNLYQSNGYILYSTLADAGIPNPKRYLQALVNAPTAAEHAPAVGKKGGASGRKGGSSAAKAQQDSVTAIVQNGSATEEFPDSGFALSRCFLSDRLLRTLFISELEALQSGDVMYVDLSEKLPPALDHESDWEVVSARMEMLFPFLASDCISVQLGKVVVSARVLLTALPLVSAIAVDEAAKSKPGKDRSAAAVSISTAARQKVFGAVATAMRCQVDVMESAVEEVVARWEDKIKQCFADAAAAAAQRTTIESRRLRGDVEARCASLWVELSLAAKGAMWCTANLGDSEAAGTIHKAVLQTTGLAIARLLVLDECLGNDTLTEKAAPIADITAPATLQQIRSVVSAFEKKRQAPFSSVLDAVSGKATVDGLIEHLESLNSTGEFKLSMFHGINKKAEREAFAARRQEIVALASRAVCSTAQLATSYAAVVSAIVVEKYRVLVFPIPGKAVQALVAKIAKDSQIPGLLEGRDMVVRTIRQPEVQLTPEEIALFEQLRSAVVNNGSSDPSSEP